MPTLVGAANTHSSVCAKAITLELALLCQVSNECEDASSKIERKAGVFQR